MCIVVDTNTFASVFKPDCARHSEFKPVLDWIAHGKGRLVYGGTKYKRELRLAARYLDIFLEYKKTHKAVEIREDLVNKREFEILERTKGTNCDDQHIMAILDVSGCILLCSEDLRSFNFIKDQMLCPRSRRQKIRIYSSSRNSDLLCNENIVKLKNVC